MSLWDIVAGCSTAKNLKDTKNSETWAKWNSASLDIINGDGLAYTNEGGYTWNIFGANVNFVCDLEALLEGAIGSLHHGNMWAEGLLGAFVFGPGANNTITIGNSLTLNYMVGHSNNFTVMRGNPEFSVTYSPWQDGGTPIVGGAAAKNRHKLIWLAISALALLVAGFDIGLNLLTNQLNGEEEKVNGEEEKVNKDQAEIDKYNSIVKEEQKAAEAQGQVVNPDAGGVPVDPTLAQKELEHAEHQHHSDEATLKSDEATLKKIETRYEWTIFSNIIAENRGIFLLKFLEQLCAGVKTVENELKDLTNTVVNLAPAPDTINEDNKASVQQEIENIENIILQLETLAAIPQLSIQLLQDLWTQTVRANNVKGELEKKIKDYEDAARQSEQLLDVSNISNASE